MPWGCFLDVGGTNREGRVKNLAAKGREQSTEGEDSGVCIFSGRLPEKKKWETQKHLGFLRLKYLGTLKGAQELWEQISCIQNEPLVISCLKILSARASENKCISALVMSLSILYFWMKYLPLMFSIDIFAAFYCHIGRWCHLWINLHLVHLQNIRASCQDASDTHKVVISLPLVVLLFITQLQQQFFPLTYFLSITIGDSPGYCCCFALIVFKSQKRDWRRYQSNLCSLGRFFIFSAWGHPWPF